jgi:1-acyl-sn-glycerol-3-phosphate acyltransferase
MSVPDKNAYRPGNPRWFNRILRATYGIYLRVMYRIKTVNTEVFSELRPPYVIVPNHVCLVDPFMIGSNVPEPVYWIASDGNMRTRLMRALLRLVGTIPKSKYIPDLQTINGIVNVIRKRKGVVGIFPEGMASFDGHTQSLIPATGKLLKLLKVPVVTAVVKGGFYSLPRWSWKRRRGAMEIEFKVALTAEDVKRLTPEEILRQVQASLEHDEAEWLRSKSISFSGKHSRAENLETVLFQCPSCGAVGTMRSRKDRFHCIACGHTDRLDRFYRFRPMDGKAPRFATIREWSLWQEKAFRSFLEERISKNSDAPLFWDTGVFLLKGWKLSPMRRVRTGKLVLYRDRVELVPLVAPPILFPLAEVEGEGVLKRNLFEFYRGRTLYQARFPTRFSSARKWMMAIGILREPHLAGLREGLPAS